MLVAFTIACIALSIVILGLELTPWVRNLLRFRGKRVITCPETLEPAAVEVDAKRAASTAALGGSPALRLSECTRWPERSGCGQECLAQIEASPEDCLARTMLTRWYIGKSCAWCGKVFTEINWHDHKPALMDQERRTVLWDAVAAETIPSVLQTHLPVCWNCHIAETFRREHPDLVTDRPWRKIASS